MPPHVCTRGCGPHPRSFDAILLHHVAPGDTLTHSLAHSLAHIFLYFQAVLTEYGDAVGDDDSAPDDHLKQTILSLPVKLEAMSGQHGY